MKTVLSIAGSDCSGGAGIQADLKTIGAFGLYGMSVVTAITVQNTCGVRRVEPMSSCLVEEQMRAVFEDIPPDAVKIGMVADSENIRVIASVIREYKPVVILDPVMVSTSGKALLDECAVDILTGELFPLAELITPNLPEAEFLLKKNAGHLSEEQKCCISSDQEREEAAIRLADRYGCSVLVKGGHGAGSADDLLYERERGRSIWYKGERIKAENTHGTGCTLSSAIACGRAEGMTLEESVRAAKEYVAGAIRDGMDLGKGNGPLNHFFRCK